MKIGIIGLGLIGSSLAEAFSVKTNHEIYGFDIDPKVNQKALDKEYIKAIMEDDLLKDMDLLVLALYPNATLDYIISKRDKLKEGAIVLDTAGIKGAICKKIWEIEDNFIFIGGHPMTGKHMSGIDYADKNLFVDSSMILVPGNRGCPQAIFDLFHAIGSKTIVSTPQEHDRMIAYTSQLAHIVSNAYVKSPQAPFHHGFSAGSYMDLTRVAYLNENMWADLFLLNDENLLYEINTIIDNLSKVKEAIENKDKDQLKKLLKEGSDIKKEVDM